jgi:hypothetical protein
LLKDLRKTAATYYDEHVPESSIEILGHSVAGVTYRHYAHRAALAFRAIMTPPQPSAFAAMAKGFDGHCPCSGGHFWTAADGARVTARWPHSEIVYLAQEEAIAGGNCTRGTSVSGTNEVSQVYHPRTFFLTANSNRLNADLDDCRRIRRSPLELSTALQRHPFEHRGQVARGRSARRESASSRTNRRIRSEGGRREAARNDP